VLLGVNMQTSFMHPPFGFALFYLRSVAPPEVKTTQIYWGAVPFVAIQLVAVALIITFPGLVGSGVDARAPGTGTPAEVVLPAPEGSSLLDSQDYGDLFAKPPPQKKDGGE
jgi:hypothetical protein